MAGGQKHMIVIRPVAKGAAPGERDVYKRQGVSAKGGGVFCP